jgi:hypothetical protein
LLNILLLIVTFRYYSHKTSFTRVYSKKKKKKSLKVRAGLGVSQASPWARATPHPRATNWEKKKFILYIIKIK